MVSLTEKERQVLDLIGSLPPDRRRLMLHELARGSDAAWRRNTTFAETQLRGLATARGLVWDDLDDEQRQDFACGLLREDD